MRDRDVHTTTTLPSSSRGNDQRTSSRYTESQCDYIQGNHSGPDVQGDVYHRTRIGIHKFLFREVNRKSCKGTISYFNSERAQVIIADANQFGTGQSFYGVREIVLMNPALSWAEHKQWVGRALRACDQPANTARDPYGKVTVTTFVLKGNGKLKTPDEYAWENLEKRGQTLEESLQTNIREKAIEYGNFSAYHYVGNVSATYTRGEKNINIDGTIPKHHALQSCRCSCWYSIQYNTINNTLSQPCLAVQT